MYKNMKNKQQNITERKSTKNNHLTITLSGGLYIVVSRMGCAYVGDGDSCYYVRVYCGQCIHKVGEGDRRWGESG